MKWLLTIIVVILVLVFISNQFDTLFTEPRKKKIITKVDTTIISVERTLEESERIDSINEKIKDEIFNYPDSSIIEVLKRLPSRFN